MGIGTHAVKVKLPGMKRWEFLSSTGALTHLRIHACTFSKEDAVSQAQYIAENNDETQTKAVEL